MKVKEIKDQLQKLPDDAEIKINYIYKNRGYLKEIEGIRKVFDQDTNQGCIVINTMNYIK